jgi:hypothetical protein
MPPLAPNVTQAGLLRGLGGWNNSSMSPRNSVTSGLLSTRTPQSLSTTGGGILNPSIGIGVTRLAMPRNAAGTYRPPYIPSPSSACAWNFNNWTKVPNPGPAGDDDGFGVSLAISGNTIVAGAPFENGGAGAVYISTDSGVSWTKVPNPNPIANDNNFGLRVAVNGNTIVIGSPNDDGGGTYRGAIYISLDSGLGFTRVPNPGPSEDDDAFGASVAVWGSAIVAGAPFDNTGGTWRGAVYISTDSGVNWSKKPNPGPGAANNDRFGYSVALSGSTIVAGVPNDDTGGTNRGAVYISSDLGGIWSKVPNPEPSADNDQFGFSVAIMGNTIVSGAPYDDTGGANRGAVYISTDSGVNWDKVTNPGPGASDGDSFGWSVGVSGSTIVGGAPFDDTNGSDRGAAYVSTDSGVNWTKVPNPGPGENNGDQFGYSVGVTDSTIIVSATDDDTGGPNRGAVYITRCT